MGRNPREIAWLTESINCATASSHPGIIRDGGVDVPIHFPLPVNGPFPPAANRARDSGSDRRLLLVGSKQTRPVTFAA